MPARVLAVVMLSSAGFCFAHPHAAQDQEAIGVWTGRWRLDG